MIKDKYSEVDRQFKNNQNTWGKYESHYTLQSRKKY